MYALPKGRYIHGTVEKFAARKHYKLSTMFQKCFTCFKSIPNSRGTNLLLLEFPNPPLTAPLGRLQSSHCAQIVIAPLNPNSSRLQAFGLRLSQAQIILSGRLTPPLSP